MFQIKHVTSVFLPKAIKSGFDTMAEQRIACNSMPTVESINRAGQPDKKVQFGIFHRTLLATLTASLTPLVIFGVINSIQIQQAVEKRVEQDLQATLNTITAKVDSWTDETFRVLGQNALLADVTSMQSSRQNLVMKSIVKTHDWMYSAFTIDLDGYINGHSNAEQEPLFNPDGTKAEYRGDREYFKQVVEGGDHGKQILISKKHNLPALCLSIPIKGTQQQLLGLLATCSTLEDVSKTVTQSRIGNTGFAILVDPIGRAIAHGRPEFVSEQLQDLSSHPALQSSVSNAQQLSFKYEGKDYVAYVGEAGLGWKLIVQQEVGEAFAPVTQARIQVLVVLVASIILVFLISVTFSQRLVQPIKVLTQNTEDISRGQLEIEIQSTGRTDEVGDLARAIKRLTTSLKVAFSQLQPPSL